MGLGIVQGVEKRKRPEVKKTAENKVNYKFYNGKGLLKKGNLIIFIF